MGLLQGQVTLITGATRGIGREIALEFARQGSDVAFTYQNNSDLANSLISEIQSIGCKVFAFQADAADFNKAQEVIDTIVAKAGKLDCVINNAGITKDNLLLRMTEEQFDTVVNTNLKSVFNYTKAASKIFLKAKKGCFINISSIVGLTGNAGQANYAASKAGIIGFTNSIAKELGSRSIRANTVAPGFIQTEMTANLPDSEIQTWLQKIPLKRPGTPKDVAGTCVFLASPYAAYITGQVIIVDGGMFID